MNARGSWGYLFTISYVYTFGSRGELGEARAPFALGDASGTGSGRVTSSTSRPSFGEAVTPEVEGTSGRCSASAPWRASPKMARAVSASPTTATARTARVCLARAASLPPIRSEDSCSLERITGDTFEVVFGSSRRRRRADDAETPERMQRPPSAD